MWPGSTTLLMEPHSAEQKPQGRVTQELAGSTLMESLLCHKKEKRGEKT